MDFDKLTVAGALAGLRSGEFTSAELVRALIARMETSQKELNAFVLINADEAIAAAEAADKARAEGCDLPLLGLPVAVKDNMSVNGHHCTAGSKILKDYVSPFDATVVTKLRAAGAIILGRTNMDEFALGSTTETSVYGPSVNPKAPGCIPGGSSGGSAAAVAGGVALAALGSDTGGSIRQPASHCGVVGVKPSFGRVSRHGVIACSSSMDVVGPLTKTVEDAAILMNVLAGSDPADAASFVGDVPDYTTAWAGADAEKPLAGMTFGLPKEAFGEGIDPEVAALVNAAKDRAIALGATVKDVSLPHADYTLPIYYIIMCGEFSANMARIDGVRYGLRVDDDDIMTQYKKSRGAGFGPETKRRILMGTYVLTKDMNKPVYRKALKARTLISDDYAAAFAQCDALLLPSTPEPAWKIGAHTDDLIRTYKSDLLAAGANLCGCCAISVPAGTTAEGKPVGVQIMAPALGEMTLFKAAKALELPRA